MRQDTNYAYAVARIKVMENRLLKDADFDALINADPEDILSVLSGYGYQANIAVPSTAAVSENDIDPLIAFQNSLSGFFSWSVIDIMKFSPEPEALSILLYPYDFANAKICIKSIAGSRSGELPGKPKLGDSGTVNSDALWNAFIKNDFTGINYDIAYGSRKALAELTGTGNARKSDIILDKACYSSMRQAAGKCSFSTWLYLKKYLKIYADWKNYITALRIRRFSAPKELMDQAYIEGNIKKEYFLKALSDNSSVFADTPYEEFVKKEIRSGSDRKSGDMSDSDALQEIERLSDKYLEAYTDKTKNEPYKINAIFVYLNSLKREISRIRIIIVGKRAGLSGDEIRKLLA